MQNLPTCGFLDMTCELAKSHQIASKCIKIAPYKEIKAPTSSENFPVKTLMLD
jgi:hypothetical protein